ncbi:hypothetical protein SAMN07250955_106205 [Arboricoccus pini]|uniref:PsiF repeat-containing protein n=1 Tax=Arboricoccus pini TaxID=1963835 RepID=A0A212R8N8_9PROT|nr:hypothetical protein SAMN07250955_106205 [Arboricoccus pini]
MTRLGAALLLVLLAQPHAALALEPEWKPGHTAAEARQLREKREENRKAEQRYWRSKPLHCDTATECQRARRLRGDGSY